MNIKDIFSDKRIKFEEEKRKNAAFLVSSVRTGHNVTSINYVRYCLLLSARSSAFTKNIKQLLHIHAQLGKRIYHI